ncbi:1,4-dihydroxy-2-naphthoyl-CoA hydrolase (EC 3.1.2.28) in menaquinone biosynthesis, partial [Arthrobacter sp. DR-2P]
EHAAERCSYRPPRQRQGAVEDHPWRTGREDGRENHRGVRPARGGHHAGGGEPAVLRAAPWRRFPCRGRGRGVLGRGDPCEHPGQDGRGRGRIGHPPPLRAGRPGDHHGHPHPPRRHPHHPRGAYHQRGRPAALHPAHHQPAHEAPQV